MLLPRLPALIRRFYEAKIQKLPQVVVWGTGTPLREFLHVDDLVKASLFLMDHYTGNDFFNVGYGEEISIGDLARLVKKVTGYQGELIFDSSKPDGTPRKLTDISRIKSLGWSPEISLEEGIRDTYSWFCRQEEYRK